MADRTNEPRGRAHHGTKAFFESDGYFAFVVGSMRVVGALFVAVGVVMLLVILFTFHETTRSFGGSTGVVGALMFISAFIVLGLFCALGGHVPFMRALREMSEEQRRIDEERRRK